MSILLLLGLVITAQTADVQTTDASSTRQCTGARRNEVCTAAGQAALRQELGVASMEDEVAVGVEAYRAFYLEGGGGLPAVAFVRRPGQNPVVEVYGGPRGATMTRDISIDVWNQVRADSVIADRVLAPLPGGAALIDEVCMDGGAVMVEIGAPATAPSGPASVRRLARSSCSDGPTLQFVRQLARLAVASFPACSAIESDWGRDGSVMVLRDCFRLTGDRLAAVEVMNRFKGEPWGDEAGAQMAWRRTTGVDDYTRLTLNGELIRGDAPRVLVARLGSMQNLRLVLSKVHGVSSREVRTEGWASYVEPTAANRPTLNATFTQVWRWTGAGQGWSLAEWRFEPFEGPKP